MKNKIAALLLLGGLEMVRADVLYNQPAGFSQHGGNVSSSWTDEESAAGTGFQTFDNFSLATGGTVNQVSWVGLYINGSVFLNEPANTTSWDIDFYADNAGVPGSLLASTGVTTAQVVSQILGTAVFGGATFTMYEFTASIPDFDAAAGTTYWFSPFSHNPDESAKFIWVDGTGGDNSSYQQRLSAGNVTGNFVVSLDRAVSLSDVPEPSSFLFVGAGVALALKRLRLNRFDRK